MPEAIPFLREFYHAIRIGEKTMTSRTRKYGEPGDTLEAIFRNPGEGWSRLRVQLLEVRRVRLGDVAERHWREEGLGSMDEFVDIWKQIHPGRGYDPEQVVWLHVFGVADEPLNMDVD